LISRFEGGVVDLLIWMDLVECISVDCAFVDGESKEWKKSTLSYADKEGSETNVHRHCCP